jgi:beta-lactamase class A
MRCVRRAAAGLALVWLLDSQWAPATASPDARLAAATPKLEATIRESGAEVGVAFETLDARSGWLRGADEPFHAASTMKVPVLIELYKERREGKLKLEDALPVRNEFHSVADGSGYALDPADDSETELYRAVGGTRTLGELSELMIDVSSNLATNLLIQRLGVENIRATVHALGADGMRVLRGVEDSKAFARGLNNTTTARALLVLMEAIARGEAVDESSSRDMQAILERQTFNDGIPAGLPPGTRVAHKTGEITRIQHDAAIVLAPRPFVLVVLTRGIDDPKRSSALIACIARQVYAATE